MMNRKYKLTKMGKILFIGLVTIICIITILAIYFFMKKETATNIIINNEKYSIKIDYPVVENKKLSKEIRNYIDTQKNEFIKEVKELETLETKYDFISSFSQTTMDNITSIHIKIFSFIGGNHYMREDISYHLNTNSNEIVDLSYFLDNETSLTRLSKLAKYYVNKYLEANKSQIEDFLIDEGTSVNLSNYQIFSFNDTGLEIVFPPYQVASWADGEISITISYSELEGILKPAFLKGINVIDHDSLTPKKRNIDEFKGSKLIAFTFDDGPSNGPTNRLLDGLNELDARVTFFVLGSRVNTYQNSLKRAYEMGNQIGSHTYNHLNLLKLSDYNVYKEIRDTNRAVKNIIGVEPTLLRPPYGNINDDIKKEANMDVILWDVDTLDWKLKNRYKIKDEILKHAHDGAIVLLHDIYMESVEGALLAMWELKEEGYNFVTIDEMAKLKESSLDKSKTIHNFK